MQYGEVKVGMRVECPLETGKRQGVVISYDVTDVIVEFPNHWVDTFPISKIEIPREGDEE